MCMQFHVTYDIVEHGDVEECGFVLPYDHVVLAPGVKDACGLTLRQALRLVGTCENSGFWFTEIDGRIDCHTSGDERRSLHCPDTITTSSYRRIGRLVGAMR